MLQLPLKAVKKRIVIEVILASIMVANAAAYITEAFYFIYFLLWYNRRTKPNRLSALSL